MITLIAAHGDNLVIGKDGWMPWHLKEDLRTYKKLTMNHKIVMGRKTFESLKKPLPGRFTYVVTNRLDCSYAFDNVEVVHDFEALLLDFKPKAESLMICGGASIYAQALPYADELWISLVDEHYEGDTYFPDYSKENLIVATKEKKEGFTLIHYLRKD